MDTKTFNVSIAMLGLTTLQLVVAQQILINSDPHALSDNTVMLLVLAGLQVAIYAVGFIVIRFSISHMARMTPTATQPPRPKPKHKTN